MLDLVHKGTCSNHIRDVTKMLKNHLTITASSIDDLDEDVILRKLSKITSAYNFENRMVPTDEKIVIGTNYSKVVPKKEIDCVKRDEFWKKEEEIEKARVAAELEAKRLANLKIEEERQKREQREHLKREQLNKELDTKNRTISEPKAEIKPITPSKNVEKDDNVPTKPRAEELRMERRKEAQELIGNKVNTAKMMFQQQAANSTQIIQQKAAPAKPIRKTIHKTEPEPVVTVIIPPNSPPKEPESTPEVVSENAESADDEQFSTIKRSPKTPTTPEYNNEFIVQDNGTTDNTQNTNDNVALSAIVKEEKIHVDVQKQKEEQFEEQQREPEPIEEDQQHLLKAIALYDYQAADDTEITFDPG